MKLAPDPGFQAYAFDAFHIAWARTVAEPVERVQDGFILRQLGDRQFALEGQIESRIEWLRRRNMSRGGCGRRRPIMQAILLVPTSSAAISAERLAEIGFILGASDDGRALMRCLPS